jgi:hypothetical protein
MAMETASLITPDQLMTPAVFADPYPVYRQLRDQTPLSYLIPPGTIPGLDEPIHAWALMKQGTTSAIRQTASHLVFGFRQLPLVLNVR